MKMFFGGIVLAIGILIAGASGLCTITFVVSALGNATNSHNEFGGSGMLPLVAIVGGIPFMIGVGLVVAGSALIKSNRDDDRY